MTDHVESTIEHQGSEWDQINPLHLEQAIRNHFEGITLVGELDLSPDSDLYLQSQSVVRRALRRGQLGSLAATFPAALITYLVAEGIYRYRGGAYWDQLSLEPPLEANQTTKVGRSFLASLEALALETFSSVRLEEHALTFVMPILLHGGIPFYSAPDLWRLLLAELNSGLDEADQVLSKWNRSRWALVSLDKPVQRFVRHGGVFAVDLVQRMIDLIEYVGELGRDEAITVGSANLATYAGIPAYLVDALFQAGQIHRTPGGRLPRPRVILDPYSGEGPAMILPPFAGASQDERWFLRWGSDSESIAASRVEERELPLEPADQWTVALGSTGREWSRGGVEGLKVLFFDRRTGELLIDQKRIRAKSVLALSSRSVRFLHAESEESLRIQEEFPDATGLWTGWVLHAIDLHGIRKFRLREGEDDGTIRLISVSAVGEQPALIDAPVQGVSDSLGRPVFNTPPTLAVDTSTVMATNWSVRFRSDDGSVTERKLSELPCTESSYDLVPLLQRPSSLIAGELLVRGPLGSDFRTRFVVIDGLELTPIDEVLHPDTVVSIALSAPGVALNGSDDSVALQFPPRQDVLSVTAISASTEIELRVAIPRVSWFVRTTDGVSRTFDSKTETLALRDLEKGIIDALLIRARREALVQLQLLVDGEPRHATEWALTVGAEGRWTFNLREFATTAAHSGKAKLDFRLVIDSINLTPLSVYMEHEVSAIRVESLVDPNERCTLCHIEWRENRVFEDRAVWLWSEDRPWQEPFRHLIDDAASGSTEIFVPHDALPPGRYLLEIGVHDLWIRRARPSTRAGNVALVTLGNPADVQPYRKSLNKEVPIECLELVLVGSEKGATLHTFGPRLSTISHEIGAALSAIIDDRREGASSHPVARELFSIISRFPELLLSTLDDIARMGTNDDVTRFMIAILPDLLDRDGPLISSEVHERLWRFSMLAGAAVDVAFSTSPEETNDRWERYTGWSPAIGQFDSPDVDGPSETPQLLPALGAPIDRFLTTLPVERLEEIIDITLGGLRLDQMLILQGDGFQQFGLRLLKTVNSEDSELLANWRSRYNQLNDRRARSNELLETALHAVAPVREAPAWTGFLQDLLAASIHLITIPDSRPTATLALTEALPISSSLVVRNLVLAILFTHWSKGPT